MGFEEIGKENIVSPTSTKRKFGTDSDGGSACLISPDPSKTASFHNPYNQKTKKRDGSKHHASTNHSMVSSSSSSPYKYRTGSNTISSHPLPNQCVINPYLKSSMVPCLSPSNHTKVPGSFTEYEKCMSDLQVKCVVCDNTSCSGEGCLNRYACFRCGNEGHGASNCKSVIWLNKSLHGLACFECLQRGQGHTKGNCPLKRRLRRLIMTSGLLKHSKTDNGANKQKALTLQRIYADQKDDKYQKFIVGLYHQLPIKNKKKAV